jgi:hypothetical protein
MGVRSFSGVSQGGGELAMWMGGLVAVATIVLSGFENWCRNMKLCAMSFFYEK